MSLWHWDSAICLIKQIRSLLSTWEMEYSTSDISINCYCNICSYCTECFISSWAEGRVPVLYKMRLLTQRSYPSFLSRKKNKQNVFEQIFFIVDHVADTPSCFDLQFCFFLIRLDWKAELPWPVSTTTSTVMYKIECIKLLKRVLKRGLYNLRTLELIRATNAYC